MRAQRRRFRWLPTSSVTPYGSVRDVRAEKIRPEIRLSSGTLGCFPRRDRELGYFASGCFLLPVLWPSLARRFWLPCWKSQKTFPPPQRTSFSVHSVFTFWTAVTLPAKKRKEERERKVSYVFPATNLRGQRVQRSGTSRAFFARGDPLNLFNV